jgi:hypothetical protein
LCGLRETGVQYIYDIHPLPDERTNDMATLVATFSDPSDAQRAAAELQERGFGNVTLGMSDAGPSSFLGLGETVQSFKNRITLGSTLGGAATGAAALGFLGFVSMGFTELRNMGTVDMLPTLITWVLAWAITGLILGTVAGLGAGLLAASWIAGAAERAAAQGQGVSRPQIVVPLPDRASEDAAVDVLKAVGAYEVARRRTVLPRGRVA